MRPKQVAGGGSWLMVDMGGDFACGVKTDNSLMCWVRHLCVVVSVRTAVCQRGPRPACRDTTCTPAWGTAPRLIAGRQTQLPLSTCGWPFPRARHMPAPSAQRGACTAGELRPSACWLRQWGAVANHRFASSACRGYNTDGQLGDGTLLTRSAPARVGADSDWSQISAGGTTTCAIHGDGRLSCWASSRLCPCPVFLCGVGLTCRGVACLQGDNALGKVGDGTVTSRSLPVPVAIATSWAFVSVSAVATCGTPGDPPPRVELASQTTVANAPFYPDCWGTNSHYSWGTGASSGTRAVPEGASDSQWLQLSAGETGTQCGITVTSLLHCWGYAAGYGALGDGASISNYSPTQVSGGGKWKSVSAASHHVSLGTCTLLWIPCRIFRDIGFASVGVRHQGQRQPVLLG